MNRETKRKLLTRKFSSVDYMEEMHDYFGKGLVGLRESIQWFYDHPPKYIDWQSWHISDRPDGWEERAIPNFEGIEASIKQGIDDYKIGDSDRIRGTSNNIMSLSKDMDVLGDEWWDYVPPEVKKQYADNMYGARKRASNIWRTVGEYWKSPESILKESITGPIDEQDLLRYLQPGEEA